MAELIDITLLAPHRVLGSLRAEGAQCAIHKGVARDLIERGIAELTDEPTENTSDGDGGESLLWHEPSGGWRSVAPRADTLLLFRSDRVLHKVAQVRRRPRHTLSCHYLGYYA